MGCRLDSHGSYALRRRQTLRIGPRGFEVRNSKNDGVLGHFAKTDVRYWQQVLFQQSSILKIRPSSSRLVDLAGEEPRVIAIAYGIPNKSQCPRFNAVKPYLPIAAVVTTLAAGQTSRVTGYGRELARAP